MSAPVLVAIAGGRNQPELITVERRTVEETEMELAVSRAERLTFCSTERTAWLLVLSALSQPQPDVARAEQIATRHLRLSVKESVRAAAVSAPDPSPAAVAA